MTKKFLIIFAVLLFVTAIPAFAALTSGPFTTSTPILSTRTNWSESSDNTSLAFAKFNIAGATLTKVTLELTGDMDTEISITNVGNSTSTGNISTHLLVYVKYSGLNLGEPQINMYSTPLEFTNLAMGGTAEGTYNDIALYALKNYTSSAILNEFKGIGNIVLDADTYTMTSIEASGSFSNQQITDASLTGTVTYEYTVPEPMTIGLLSMGGLAILRRKKNS